MPSTLLSRRGPSTAQPAPPKHTLSVLFFAGEGQHTLDFFVARDANANSFVTSCRTNIMSSPIQLSLVSR